MALGREGPHRIALHFGISTPDAKGIVNLHLERRRLGR